MTDEQENIEIGSPKDSKQHEAAVHAHPHQHHHHPEHNKTHHAEGTEAQDIKTSADLPSEKPEFLTAEAQAKELGKEAAQTPAPPTPKPQMSKGEKVYDWTVYTGLNYWVNLISSLAIADYLLNPASSGRKTMNNIIEKGTLGVEKLGVPLKAAHHNSKIWLETLALMSGGWLLLVPMKYLEDNKRKIVHWANEKLGIDQTAPDGHKETPDEIYIECEQPKQSWGNVFLRRIYATLAVTSSGLALDHIYKNKDKILDPETYVIGGREIIYDAKPLGGKDRLTGQIVEQVNKGLKYIKADKIIEHAPTQRWIALAALDTFFTVITAAVMKMTNGAKKAHMPNEIDDGKDKPAHEVVNAIVPDLTDEPKKKFAEQVGKREKQTITRRERNEEKHESFLEGVLENKPALGFASISH